MPTPSSITRIYYALLLGNTLAASLIWGINTIFLLDAGLSNLEAFAANAAWTVGTVLFEVPTGIVADMRGRRLSFLLGTLVLAAGTGLYVLLWYVEAGFWLWAIVSVVIGLGYTFFSGATEAWLVDALQATGYEGELETVFGRGQAVNGAAMLIGSVAGGYLAQLTNLGVPFVLRVVILLGMFTLAFAVMRDVGFTPERGRRPLAQVRHIVANSVEYGWRVPAVKWLMLAAPWAGGVGAYAFYALQPHLLNLYGDPEAYGIAGLAAAIVAGAQIAGGFVSATVGRMFGLRTTALLIAGALSAVVLLLIGVIESFWPVIALIVIWGLLFAAAMPIRQSYLNAHIPSQQRATILSFDSLMTSTGAVVAQPALGRSADVWGYPTSYLLGGIISAVALPFIGRARRVEAGEAAGPQAASPETA